MHIHVLLPIQSALNTVGAGHLRIGALYFVLVSLAQLDLLGAALHVHHELFCLGRLRRRGSLLVPDPMAAVYEQTRDLLTDCAVRDEVCRLEEYLVQGAEAGRGEGECRD